MRLTMARSLAEHRDAPRSSIGVDETPNTSVRIESRYIEDMDHILQIANGKGKRTSYEQSVPYRRLVLP